MTRAARVCHNKFRRAAHGGQTLARAGAVSQPIYEGQKQAGRKAGESIFGFAVHVACEPYFSARPIRIVPHIEALL
jgi:hypothetical protein